MPDTLFANGKIFLSGSSPGTNPSPTQLPTFASHLLISGSLITAVGDTSNPAISSALSSPETTVHDLAGLTILPGFIDGHMHLMLLGQSLQKLPLDHCTSLQDIRDTISRYALANPSVPRILCRGWMHSMTDPHAVTAKDLDHLPGVNGRPILIDTKDLHSTWANTAAIEELGAKDWPDVPGGTIERVGGEEDDDDDGEEEERGGRRGYPSGVFSEAANITYVWPYLARVASAGERVGAIRAAVRAYHAVGYTGMVDMAMDEGAWEAVLLTLAQPGGLGMRIAAYWLVKPSGSPDGNLKQVERAAELAKLYNAHTSPDCRIVGIKVICDGIIDACTAGLTDPYAHTGEGVGPLWAKEDLAPVVERAGELGLQVALHAIGDETIKMVVDVLAAHSSPDRRPRIEHVELASQEDAQRLGRLGITASVQPVHADPAILGAWPRLLGEHRCRRAFPYREFADGGAMIALGSDSPTAPYEPLGNVYVGTTRRSFRRPETENTVNEHFRLGLCEALVAATEGASYSCFAEGRVGSLREGLKADFVLVDMHWDEKKLLEARTRETWFDGRRVWSAED